METLNIRQFKLINGEDVIAVRNTKNDDNYIRISESYNII